MANLRGKSLYKQVRNAFFRLEAFRESRQGKEDHLTHSLALAKKRMQALKSFAKFLENRNYEGKLNVAIRKELMDEYFEERLKRVSKVTAEDILRLWSSMLQGLEEKNININLDIEGYFDHKVEFIKDTYEDAPIKMKRAPKKIEKLLKTIYEIRYESGLIAEVQATFGFRISEAFELLNNPTKYIIKNQIVNIKGKGNHVYENKSITNELITKIDLITKLPCQNTYRKHVKKAIKENHIPHDFRYLFAKNSFEVKLSNGVAYEEALMLVSKEINHNRGEMTDYYLKRA